jgi:hypothetical protein
LSSCRSGPARVTGGRRRDRAQANEWVELAHDLMLADARQFLLVSPLSELCRSNPSDVMSRYSTSTASESSTHVALPFKVGGRAASTPRSARSRLVVLRCVARKSSQCFVGSGPSTSGSSMTWLISGGSPPLQSHGIPAPHVQPILSDHARSG